MNRRFFPHLALICALGVELLFVGLYLSREQTIHFWDYAMYANMARALYFQPDLSAWFGALTASFSEKYNLLYALPSQLSFPLFGATREIFILTNTAFYFLAYQLALGYLLRSLFNWSVWRSLGAALVLCAFVPFLWYPLLQGYPDHAAAACILAALGFLVRKPRSIRRLVVIGLLLGLAIVFRRHYAYTSLALMAAGGIFDFARFGWRNTLKYIFISGLSAFLVLVVFEPNYLKEMLLTNHAALYKVYDRGASYFLLFALSRIGLAPLFIAIAGWFFFFRRPLGDRLRAAFVLTFVFLWTAIWAFGPAQAGEHYLIAALPLFVLIGTASLYLVLHGRIGRALLILFLTGHSVFVLWLSPTYPVPSDAPSLSLWAAPRPPWIRGDLAELRSLALHIAQTTTHRDKVVLVGSSFVFNQDLMRAVFTDLLGDPSTPTRFLPTPEMGGDEDPPFNSFASGTVFLISDKPQYHLAPANQKTIFNLWKPFHEWALTSDSFTKDERKFSLDHDTQITIWRRIKTDPASLHEGLATMRKETNNARRWIVERGWPGTQIDEQSNQAQGSALFLPAFPLLDLFYDHPLEAGSYHLGFETGFAGSCGQIKATVAVETSNGKTLVSASNDLFGNPSLYNKPFSVPDQTTAFVRLRLYAVARGSCQAIFSGLRVEKVSP